MLSWICCEWIYSAGMKVQFDRGRIREAVVGSPIKRGPDLPAGRSPVVCNVSIWPANDFMAGA
jgi:hypothetical protein